ncbi:MAG: hypothetical protein JSS69_05345 [Acidobacteria bacterium]|nr:hypothetical protein [Acidobacteriota bacterium]MBS1865325.1 hypothetical protein [Acidobacteriota bacterium]
MRKANRVLMLAVAACAAFAWGAQAQSSNTAGALEFSAYVSPTAAKPEPVRDFTFYVLTKSFEDIRHEIEEANGAPDRGKFIDGLKLSSELREWLKGHDTLDLTMPGTDKQITAEDIIHVPEFLVAYQRSNSGGVANGIPKPKYKDSDKTDHPEKYEKGRQEYLAALKKYAQAHPESVAGMELELDSINPAKKWAETQNNFKKRVNQQAPMLAQTKYLAAKVDTNLDGQARVGKLPAGNYWLSTLDLEAGAGDSRLKWDLPVTIEAGQTARIELTNLNSTETAKFK